MTYNPKYKLKIIRHVCLGITPIEQIAQIRRIHKQTIYRWLEIFKRYGVVGLENKQPGAKQSQINVTFEIIKIISSL